MTSELSKLRRYTVVHGSWGYTDGRTNWTIMPDPKAKRGTRYEVWRGRKRVGEASTRVEAIKLMEALHAERLR
jgi:hypothetical protein